MDINELAARHAELIDKKFLAGLTPQEAGELEQIKAGLDEVLASYYELAIKNLMALKARVMAVSNTIITGR
jgi:hypothetical protein